MSRNARSSRLPSRIAVVPAARWARSEHALAASVAYTPATRMSARILGVRSLFAVTAGGLMAAFNPAEGQRPSPELTGTRTLGRGHEPSWPKGRMEAI